MNNLELKKSVLLEKKGELEKLKQLRDEKQAMVEEL